VEKQRGIQYEHSLSYDWLAMRAYLCLMRLSHAIVP
jgi:hypothetical protein